jgi:hypothetical protein
MADQTSIQTSKTLYIAYMTGSTGSSIGLYYIGDGQIAGIDVGGMKYEGIYRIESDGSYDGILSYTVPISTQLITGTATAEEKRIEAPIKLPPEFWNGQIVRIDTPLGAVNARFEKLKELP